MFYGLHGALINLESCRDRKTASSGFSQVFKKNSNWNFTFFYFFFFSNSSLNNSRSLLVLTQRYKYHGIILALRCQTSNRKENNRLHKKVKKKKEKRKNTATQFLCHDNNECYVMITVGVTVNVETTDLRTCINTCNYCDIQVALHGLLTHKYILCYIQHQNVIKFSKLICKKIKKYCKCFNNTINSFFSTIPIVTNFECQFSKNTQENLYASDQLIR